MELKISAKSFFHGMLKESAKGFKRGIVYMLMLFIANAVQQGFVIKMLGGVTQEEYKVYRWHTQKIEDGIIYRSEDLTEEKEVLQKTIDMHGGGFLLIGAHANSKYRGKYCTDTDGYVEVFIYVDDIECAHSSVYVGACRYRNDSRSLSTDTSHFQLIDRGHHKIKVVAVYYGKLERDETRFQYLTICETKAHKLN